MLALRVNKPVTKPSVTVLTEASPASVSAISPVSDCSGVAAVKCEVT